jgi:hypothetical protein
MSCTTITMLLLASLVVVEREVEETVRFRRKVAVTASASGEDHEGGLVDSKSEISGAFGVEL